MSIPAIVRDTKDDAMLRDALMENIHRAKLNPLEEAAAYQQLLEEFGATHEELARRIGRSRPQISNTIRLMNLPPAVQRRVAAGVLSAGHARALLGVEDPVAQEQLAHRIVAEGISVRATEEMVPLAPGPRRPRGGGDEGAGRARPLGSGRPALRPVRHSGEGRHRPAQGQDHRRVRHGRRPGANRPEHVAWAGPVAPRLATAPLGFGPVADMTGKSFGSDNYAGVHPDVLAAIAAANVGDAVAYGDDELTTAALTRLCATAGARQAYLVFNGTAANIWASA